MTITTTCCTLSAVTRQCLIIQLEILVSTRKREKERERGYHGIYMLTVRIVTVK